MRWNAYIIRARGKNIKMLGSVEASDRAEALVQAIMKFDIGLEDQHLVHIERA